MSRKDSTQQIEINQLVIDRMKQEKIMTDHLGTVLFVLFCLFEGKTDLLDYADDSNKERRMHFLYMNLNRRDLIQKPDGEDDKIWVLTPRGNELVTYLREQGGKKVKLKAEVLQPLAEIEMATLDCAGWIDSYVNMFPIVGKGERPLRVHPDTCINKMNAFLKKYKYSEETILAATKMYIDDQDARQEKYEYTSRADNFISKYTEGHSNYSSPLSAWCKAYLDADSPDQAAGLDTKILDMV